MRRASLLAIAAVAVLGTAGPVRAQESIDEAGYRALLEEGDERPKLFAFDRTAFVEGDEIAEFGGVRPMVDHGLDPSTLDHVFFAELNMLPAEEGADDPTPEQGLLMVFAFADADALASGREAIDSFLGSDLATRRGTTYRRLVHADGSRLAVLGEWEVTPETLADWVVDRLESAGFRAIEPDGDGDEDGDGND